MGVREVTTEIWDTVLFSLSLIVAMMAFDVGLTLLALLPVPAAMVLALATGRWVRERISAARAAAARATAALQELLAGVRVLRLFGHEATAVGRYAVLSADQAETMLATQRLRSTLAPTYTVMMVAGVIFILWLGGENVIAGLMTAGQLVAFLELYLQFVQARVPRAAAHQLGAGRRRGVPSPESAAGAGAVRWTGEPPRASFTPGYVAGLDRKPSVALTSRRAGGRSPAARSGRRERRGPRARLARWTRWPRAALERRARDGAACCARARSRGVESRATSRSAIRAPPARRSPISRSRSRPERSSG